MDFDGHGIHLIGNKDEKNASLTTEVQYTNQAVKTGDIQVPNLPTWSIIVLVGAIVVLASICVGIIIKKRKWVQENMRGVIEVIYLIAS